MRIRIKDWLATRYMAYIAGRYCPCEWPIKSKRLIRLCGKVDDHVCRMDFRKFCGFVLTEGPFLTTNTTSSNVSNVTLTWTKKP